jgi:hypothetical protein
MYSDSRPACWFSGNDKPMGCQCGTKDRKSAFIIPPQDGRVVYFYLLQYSLQDFFNKSAAEKIFTTQIKHLTGINGRA